MSSFQIKNILIPTDFSETGLLAIEHGVLMARISKATLHIIHVVKPSDYSSTNDHQPLYEKYSLEQLEKIASVIRTKNAIDIKALCKTGNPSTEIIKAVEELAIDIVIMGTHGTSGFNEYFIGSNAHKTVKTCPCPVITIQTDSHKLGFNTILLPIENSYHSLEKVNRAISIAKLYSSKIYLLGLLDTHIELEEKKFDTKLWTIEKVIKHAEVSYERIVVRGKNLATETLNFSRAHDIDLIVVMSDEESELNNTLIGLFAKHIVNHSKIPVMSIKPIQGIFTSSSPT